MSPAKRSSGWVCDAEKTTGRYPGNQEILAAEPRPPLRSRSCLVDRVVSQAVQDHQIGHTAEPGELLAEVERQFAATHRRLTGTRSRLVARLPTRTTGELTLRGASLRVEAIEEPGTSHGRHREVLGVRHRLQRLDCSSLRRRLNIRDCAFGRLITVPAGYGSLESACCSRRRASLRSAALLSPVIFDMPGPFVVGEEVSAGGGPGVQAVEIAVQILVGEYE